MTVSPSLFPIILSAMRLPEDKTKINEIEITDHIRSASFQKLEHLNRTSVTTAEAAYYLNRKPQTLRIWACYESGPLRPLRINGRLAWPVKELQRILEVS